MDSATHGLFDRQDERNATPGVVQFRRASAELLRALAQRGTARGLWGVAKVWDTNLPLVVSLRGFDGYGVFNSIRMFQAISCSPMRSASLIRRSLAPSSRSCEILPGAPPFQNFQYRGVTTTVTISVQSKTGMPSFQKSPKRYPPGP